MRFVFLHADEALLRRRLATRQGHFAGAALVPSQLRTLEAPDDAIVVDAASAPPQIADQVIAALRADPTGYEPSGHRPGEDTVASDVPTPTEQTDIETLLRELGDLVAALADTNDLVRRRELWAEAKPRADLIDRLVNG